MSQQAIIALNANCILFANYVLQTTESTNKCSQTITKNHTKTNTQIGEFSSSGTLSDST